MLMNQKHNNHQRFKGNTEKTLRQGATYRWKTVNHKYENFTDLGDYVIDCDRHRNFDFEKARRFTAERADLFRHFACSALATKTDRGDVLIGRNLDLTISQFPCYITHLRYGKYETINFTYDEMSGTVPRYGELLRKGEIDADFYNALPMLASDSMNEKGLYLEYNMREYEPQFFCAGTNPGATRVCSVSLPFLVASHCATVDEALRYMREELDIYTIADDTIASGWNLCLVIGDAAGSYGLIEIANDEIKYLPYQNGQGNYYIYPAFNVTSRGQSGYGRLQFGLERIDRVQSEEDMAALMEKIMWRGEILDIPYAYRDDAGHICFSSDAEHKTPSLDWRSDNVKKLPVDESGHYVDTDEQTPEAAKVRAYQTCYERFMRGEESEYNRRGYEQYVAYLGRSNLDWVYADENFEDLRRGLIRHYTENGTYEKMARYYAGDEGPLRDDANIMTTALSFSVNCTKKRLTVKFWEKPDTVMRYQW